ncbi:MAG TPA: hypothetical protein VHI54_08395, partial [Actinomycetota bacterium]|nr:hypothetical protein [Actinomycetota bacterium]
KLTTTRGTFGLIAGAAVVASLGAFSTITSGEPTTLGGELRDQQSFFLASLNLAMFALVAGIRSFTDEFRHGTIVPTFLVAPGRGRVLLAKSGAAAVNGAVLVIAAQAVMLAVSIPLLGMKGVTPGWSSGDVLAGAGLVAAGAFWSMIGVGVGALVRHQVAAIVGGLVWILVVENLGAGFLRDAAQFLPGQAAHGLARVTANGVDVLSAPAAAVVLALYAIGAGLFGLLALVRRDVATG